jgi:cystathionine beta-lyase/cystathionine gamma-synthase
MAPKLLKRHLNGTSLNHADDGFSGPEVGPSISVSSTFKRPQLNQQTIDGEFDPTNPTRHEYSRYSQNVSTRAELVLGNINGGYAITYASGIAAAFAALVFYRPKRVAISGGYHGCHATIEVFKKIPGNKLQVIDIDDQFQEGDLCWLETPLNPIGVSRDIKYYADKIHAVGGHLLVDSTFAPPPLQYPLKWGTDCVLHSASKYFGGHSDLLAGVLIVKTLEEVKSLWKDRIYLGSMMGSLESWLLLRSLRTLHLRVPFQSANATGLAQWLNAAASTPAGQTFDGIPGGIISKVWHSSLQGKDARGFEPKQQMEGGWNPCFGILLANPQHAKLLPHLLKCFVNATSLGGVESLIEQRLQSDADADPRLIRISVGVEELEDLKDDLRKALQDVSKASSKL